MNFLMSQINRLDARHSIENPRPTLCGTSKCWVNPPRYIDNLGGKPPVHRKSLTGTLQYIEKLGLEPSGTSKISVGPSPVWWVAGHLGQPLSTRAFPVLSGKGHGFEPAAILSSQGSFWRGGKCGLSVQGSLKYTAISYHPFGSRVWQTRP